MKKVFTGASITLVGAIIFLSVFFVAGSYASTITSWDSVSGKFWTAVSRLNLYPVLIISIIIMVVGTVVLIWGNLRNSD